MAKTRQQKEEVLSSLTDKLERSHMTVLVKYRGLKVRQTEELRGLLRHESMEMVIPKNSLAKLALKKSHLTAEDEVWNQPLAMVFSYQDEVLPAKVVAAFSKANEAAEILGGILNGQIVTASTVKALAILPPRDELLAKAVGSISAPLRNLVGTLAALPNNLVNVLSQIQKQKA